MRFGILAFSTAMTSLLISDSQAFDNVTVPSLTTLAAPRRTLPGTVFTQYEKNQFVKIINAAKAKTNPRSEYIPVNWNYALEREMLAFKAITPPSWYYALGNYPGLRGNRSNNVNHLLEQQFFAGKFPGFGFVMRDTCNDYENNVLLILRYRINQARCINYNKCNVTAPFNNFATCAQPYVPKSGQPCSWAWQYYPRLVMSSLSSIACMMLNVRSPYTPTAQNDAFACFGKFTPPINERAYLTLLRL